MLQHILHSHPIVKTDFIRAQDCYLYDSAGNKFVDFESGKWAAALGHNHPRVQKVMHEQLDKVTHLGARYTSQLAEQAAVRLLDLLGMPTGKCVFLSSGSEAVEFGVQAARLVSQKPLLLTFVESYLAAFGSAGSKHPGEWFCLDWQGCAGCNSEQECISDCRLLQNIPWDQIGGFVYEPGNAGGMVKFPPDPLVRTLASLTREHGGLVVVNEITTGIGRTGRWFGFQHADLQPDIVALGKGLGSGYPVSAVALSQPVADALETSEYHYCQSHQNDPLGCAVAAEVMNVMHDENLVERSQRLGEKFKDGLVKLAERFPQISDVRGRGLMIAVDFDRALYPGLANKIYSQMLAQGIIVGASAVYNFLRISPPLTISEDDIDLFLEKLNTILNEVIYE